MEQEHAASFWKEKDIGRILLPASSCAVAHVVAWVAPLLCQFRLRESLGSMGRSRLESFTSPGLGSSESFKAGHLEGRQ